MLRDVVSKTNSYIAGRSARSVNVGVVERVAKWVGQMLRVFGLGEGDATSGEELVGWGKEAEGGAAGANVDVSPQSSNVSSALTRIRIAERGHPHAVSSHVVFLQGQHPPIGDAEGFRTADCEGYPCALRQAAR